MYDSRTDKARKPKAKARRLGEQYNEQREAYDALTSRQRMGAIIADFDDDEPAMIAVPEDIDRLHAEALKMHAAWYEDMLNDPPLDLAPWEAELTIGGVPEGTSVAWSSVMSDFDDEVWQERMRLEDEDRRRRDAQYDHAYGGYSDDPDCGDHRGCWLPFMRIEELRETFGKNWLGNGFHIVQGNGVRR
jgi:hypothetical protein